MTLPKSKKILLLDDDHHVLDVVEEALSYEGYEVICLQKTDNIFPEIMQYHPDIVILDYQLSGKSGAELCYQIKINRHTSSTPVIVTSAYPRSSSGLQHCACDAFIPKPFDLDQLFSCISRLIYPNLPVKHHA